MVWSVKYTRIFLMCMIHAYVAVGFPVPSFEFLFERKEQNRPLTIRHKTRREFANQCLYGLHVILILVLYLLYISTVDVANKNSKMYIGVRS